MPTSAMRHRETSLSPGRSQQVDVLESLLRSRAAEPRSGLAVTAPHERPFGARAVSASMAIPVDEGFEASPTEAFVTDAYGRVLAATRPFGDRLGVAASTLCHRPFTVWLAPRNGRIFRAALLRLRGSGTIAPLAIDLRRRDRTTFRAELAPEVVFGEHGDVRAIQWLVSPA